MKAINLFKKTRNPNHVVYILCFQACAQIASNECLNIVKTISNDLPHSLSNNKRVITSLIDAFVECGDIEKAESIYDSTSIQSIEMTGALMKGK